jgi:hypothetical protein
VKAKTEVLTEADRVRWLAELLKMKNPETRLE